MLVVVALCELQIEFSESLKDKRTVVRSLLDKLRDRFQVAATEVSAHDVHQLARIGMTWISLDNPSADSKLSKLQEFVESHTDATVAGWAYEKLDFDDAIGVR